MGVPFVQKGDKEKKKKDQEYFPFVSHTLQMTVCCFPGPVQALEMGDKGSQWVKANS